MLMNSSSVQKKMSQEGSDDTVANTKKKCVPEELSGPGANGVEALPSSPVLEDTEKTKKEIDEQTETDQRSEVTPKVAYKQTWSKVTIGGQGNRWGVNGEVPEGGEQNWSDIGLSNDIKYAEIKGNEIGINFGSKLTKRA